MNADKKGLREHQEQVLSMVARKALDDGRPIDSLSLLERAAVYHSENVVTLLILLVDRQTGSQLKEWGLKLLNRQLTLCVRPAQLLPPALWMRNPIRADLVPKQLKTLIDDKRRSLEPEWDGVWQDPGLASSNVGLMLLKRPPEEVFEPGECLIAASQVRNWNPWLKRYRELGGRLEDPKYLKLWIARAVVKRRRPTQQVKEMLVKYCAVGALEEVRAFLRNITPVDANNSRVVLNSVLAQYVLLVYCSWERIEHDANDWVHIARSAIYLKHTTLQRIAQRGLAGVHRPPEAHRMLEELNSLHGEINVTDNSKQDIGPKGNPIWESLYVRLPVDGNARNILIAYSKVERATI